MTTQENDLITNATTLMELACSKEAPQPPDVVKLLFTAHVCVHRVTVSQAMDIQRLLIAAYMIGLENGKAAK